MNFKKYLALFCLLFASVTTAAPLQVFACEPEWAALVQELAADQAQVFSATTAFQDPHYIQARPSLISKLRRANLLICTGADLEIGWLPLLQRRANNTKVQTGNTGYFMASDFVKLRDIPQHVDRSQGDVHPYGNPHIHLDPENVLTIAQALNQRLSQIDPDNKNYYAQKFTDFKQRWQQAMQKWAGQSEPLRGTNILVYHKSWPYLNRWLGLRQVAALEPKPGIPPSAAYQAALIDHLQTTPVDIILLATYQDKTKAQKFGKRADVTVVTLPFTVGGSKQAVDLFSLFDETLQILLKANHVTNNN